MFRSLRGTVTAGTPLAPRALAIAMIIAGGCPYNCVSQFGFTASSYLQPVLGFLRDHTLALPDRRIPNMRFMLLLYSCRFGPAFRNKLTFMEMRKGENLMPVLATHIEKEGNAEFVNTRALTCTASNNDHTQWCLVWGALEPYIQRVQFAMRLIEQCVTVPVSDTARFPQLDANDCGYEFLGRERELVMILSSNDECV